MLFVKLYVPTNEFGGWHGMRGMAQHIGGFSRTFVEVLNITM